MKRHTRASRREQCPLTLHSTGQWKKKHAGKVYYFGSDKEAALRRYALEWPRIVAGLDILRDKDDSASVSVQDACNRFLAVKRRAVDAGSLSLAYFSDCLTCCKMIAATMGKGRAVEGLRPVDFAKLREVAAEKLGPVALGNFIQRVRSVFKWVYESELVDKPVRFGPDFRKPSRRLVRIGRADAGKKLLTPEDCRALIEAASVPLRAMILLALNAGFGQTDCSELPKRAIDGDWLDFRRPKTGAPRRCYLWPETVQALRAVQEHRPHADLVFITQSGKPWVRWNDKGAKAAVRIDGIGQEYDKLTDRLGVKVRGFYALRHTHRTIADGEKDDVAAALIMGHVDESMAGKYREEIDDERLKRIAARIRAWLG